MQVSPSTPRSFARGGPARDLHGEQRLAIAPPHALWLGAGKTSPPRAGGLPPAARRGATMGAASCTTLAPRWRAWNEADAPALDYFLMIMTFYALLHELNY